MKTFITTLLILTNLLLAGCSGKNNSNGPEVPALRPSGPESQSEQPEQTATAEVEQSEQQEFTLLQIPQVKTDDFMSSLIFNNLARNYSFKVRTNSNLMWKVLKANKRNEQIELSASDAIPTIDIFSSQAIHEIKRLRGRKLRSLHFSLPLNNLTKYLNLKNISARCTLINQNVPCEVVHAKGEAIDNALNITITDWNIPQLDVLKQIPFLRISLNNFDYMNEEGELISTYSDFMDQVLNDHHLHFIFYKNQNLIMATKGSEINLEIVNNLTKEAFYLDEDSHWSLNKIAHDRLFHVYHLAADDSSLILRESDRLEYRGETPARGIQFTNNPSSYFLETSGTKGHFHITFRQEVEEFETAYGLIKRKQVFRGLGRLLDERTIQMPEILSELVVKRGSNEKALIHSETDELLIYPHMGIEFIPSGRQINLTYRTRSLNQRSHTVFYWYSQGRNREQWLRDPQGSVTPVIPENDHWFNELYYSINLNYMNLEFTSH